MSLEFISRILRILYISRMQNALSGMIFHLTIFILQGGSFLQNIHENRVNITFPTRHTPMDENKYKYH